MCFYNSNSKKATDLENRYGRKADFSDIVKQNIEEQYKISAFTFPDCAIITSSDTVQTAKWGLIPSWTKTENDAQKIRKMTLNARAETSFSMPSFRVPILQKRCLVVSTGYFEFHHEGKTVSPYFIFLKNEEIFSLGGMYEIWLNPITKNTLQTFTVLTVTANELCEKIHNGGKNPFRMPLIIDKENEGHWLDNSLNINEIKYFMNSYDSNKMDAYRISQDFLKKNPKDASILQPAA